MSHVLAFLAARWLAVALLVVGAALLAVLRRRRGALVVLGAGAVLFGGGGLLPADGWAWWVLLAASIALIGLVAAVILLGNWSSRLTAATAALGLLAAGSLTAPPLGATLRDAVFAVGQIEFAHPAWFWVLLVLPLVWRVGGGSLDYESARPWIAMGLRTVLILVLVIALAEPRLPLRDDTVTVLFVVDRSLSVPQEPDAADPTLDLRARRIVRFVNESVERHSKAGRRDRAGLIVFGGRPRAEFPPSDAPRFNLKELPPAADPNHTDIAAGLRLALATFPKGGGKRIVLVSDGNENWGDAEEQAQRARAVGAQIDVLPLAAQRRNEDEVLIERVEAPPLADRGAAVPVKVLIRSFNPNIVETRLILRQTSEGDLDARLKVGADGSIGVEVGPARLGPGVAVVAVQPGSPAAAVALGPGDEITQVDGEAATSPQRFRDLLRAKKPGDLVRLTLRSNRLVADEVVELPNGLKTYYFRRPATDENRSYTYEAEIQPLRIKAGPGKDAAVLHEGRPPGDRVQNNRASAHVLARGRRRVLLLEGTDSDHPRLRELLRQAGAGKKFDLRAEPITVLGRWPEGQRLLTDFLSDFDCVVLANVANDEVSADHQEALRSACHDQGCGLVMIGGPKGYGAGGWQNTPVEKALPVDCDIKSMKVQGKGGLVLIMHASEMAEGNFWQKKIAKLAIERLGPSDEVGVIHWGFGEVWHIPLQEVGPNRAKLMAKVDTLMPGDMPDFDGSLLMAHAALTDPKRGISTKHIIIISDGDPQHTPGVLQKLAAAKITVTTVGVATHGANEDASMAAIAKATGGRTYSVKDPRKLPAIYIKETRMVSRAFVHDDEIQPNLLFRGGPTKDLPAPTKLGGFIRTTAKENPLVQVAMVSPKIDAQEFPLVAYWRYGLGKSVAFTSDAGEPHFWSRKWYNQGVYGQFWEQAIDWALRPPESQQLSMTAEYIDGKVRVVVEARQRDEKTKTDKPDTTLRIRGGYTGPAGKARDAEQGRLTFTPTAAGRYEAEFRAEEAGTYIINAQPFRVIEEVGPDGVKRRVEEPTDGVRAGVSVPFAEFAEMETNRSLLERLRAITGGTAYEDDDEALKATAQAGTVFRPGLKEDADRLPLWHWLLLAAGLLLVADIALRRVALDPAQVRTAARRLWARLRGLPVPEGDEGEAAPERFRVRPATAARRFEAGATTGPAPPLADAAAPPPAAPAAGTTAPAAPAEDFAERMARAKKRALEQRKKENP